MADRAVSGCGTLPACVKAVAEWFPKRQRSLATGIFNTGTNFGAMLQGVILWLAVAWSWQAVFVAIGALDFVCGSQPG